jgi:hypothetical protein
VEVFFKARRVASHRRSHLKGRHTTTPEHLPGTPPRPSGRNPEPPGARAYYDRSAPASVCHRAALRQLAN